jgi:hypothetical protein
MVSSKVRSKLVEAFETLKNSTLDIHNYSGNDFDVVFDIISTDTFIAGIVDRIIDGQNIDQQENVILKKKYLENTCWITTEGNLLPLEHLPEVLEYAQVLQKVQQLCAKIIGI